MNALMRGVRNAFRNSMRTVGVVVILAVAFALAISMTIARDAVNAKIASVRSSTGNTISVNSAGSFGFQGSGNYLSESKVNGLLSVPHVTALQESLTQELTSTSTSLKSPTITRSGGFQFGGGSSGSGSSSSPFGSGSFTPPVRVIGTNSPGNALVGGANGGGTEKLVKGSAFSATSTANVALVGQTLATKNSLSVGSTFSAWGTKITVVGIYNAGSSFANADVVMPLSTVQRLSSESAKVTSVTVVVDSVDHVAGAVTAIKAKMGSSADVTSTQTIVENQLAPLNSVKTISTYTLLGSVIGAGVILLLSMLMIVRERRREVGVLKAIGARSRSVVTQFVAESTTFTVLGAVVGLAGGILLSNPITTALVNASGGSTNGPGGFVRSASGGFGSGGSGFTPPTGSAASGGGGFGFRFGGFRSTLDQLHVAAGWSTLLVALVLALTIAAVGSAVAAFNIARVRPADVLRSE